jgi:hypothetical protein
VCSFYSSVHQLLDTGLLLPFGYLSIAAMHLSIQVPLKILLWVLLHVTRRSTAISVFCVLHHFTFLPAVQRVPAFTYPHQPLVYFLVAALLKGVRWYLIVVLTCLYLMICDIKHLFMCLLATCKSSLGKYLLSTLGDFEIRLYGFV